MTEKTNAQLNHLMKMRLLRWVWRPIKRVTEMNKQTIQLMNGNRVTYFPWWKNGVTRQGQGGLTIRLPEKCRVEGSHVIVDWLCWGGSRLWLTSVRPGNGLTNERSTTWLTNQRVDSERRDGVARMHHGSESKNSVAGISAMEEKREG